MRRWRQTQVMKKITTKWDTYFLVAIMGLYKSQRHGVLFSINWHCAKKKKKHWKGEEQSSFNVLANEKIKCGNSFKCNYHVIAWANDEYCAVNSLWRNAVLLTNQIQELWYSLHLFYLKVRSMLNLFLFKHSVHCLQKQTPERYPVNF